MPTTKDEMQLRFDCVSLAGGDLKKAQQILDFVQGGAAEARPTSTKAQTDTKAADTSDGASGASTASPAPSTTETPPVDAGTGEPLMDVGEGKGDPDLPAYSGNIKDLEAACMSLAGKKGKPALAEAFAHVGAAKWSEVAEGKRGELWDYIQRAMA